MGHDPHPSIAKYLKKLGGKGVMPWKAGANNPNWRGGLYVLPYHLSPTIPYPYDEPRNR